MGNKATSAKNPHASNGATNSNISNQYGNQVSPRDSRGSSSSIDSSKKQPIKILTAKGVEIIVGEQVVSESIKSNDSNTTTRTSGRFSKHLSKLEFLRGSHDSNSANSTPRESESRIRRNSNPPKPEVRSSSDIRLSSESTPGQLTRGRSASTSATISPLASTNIPPAAFKDTKQPSSRPGSSGHGSLAEQYHQTRRAQRQQQQQKELLEILGSTEPNSAISPDAEPTPPGTPRSAADKDNKKSVSFLKGKKTSSSPNVLSYSSTGTEASPGTSLRSSKPMDIDDASKALDSHSLATDSIPSQMGLHKFPSFQSLTSGAASAADCKNQKREGPNSNDKKSNSNHRNKAEEAARDDGETTPVRTRNRVNTALDLPLNLNLAGSQESSPTNSVMDNKLGQQWLRVECPGQKVKIRSSPSVGEPPVGMLFSGEEIEVFTKLFSGFLQLVDGRVSVQLETDVTFLNSI